MKRKRGVKEKTPDAILTADWHLRDDVPVCRTDDYWAAQWTKIEFIVDLANEYDCPIYNAGDIFHKWKASPYLLYHTIYQINKMQTILVCCAGNTLY